MSIQMYLQLDGIAGEGPRGQIDILAWSWGASNSGSLQAGGVGGGGGKGQAAFQDLSVTKYIDRSSEDLLRLVATGQQLRLAELSVLRATDALVNYVAIRFRPVIVTSVSAGGSGGEDRLTENITLNFAEFNYLYTPQLPDGRIDTAEQFGWSTATGTPVNF